jgi:hypothetical protein
VAGRDGRLLVGVDLETGEISFSHAPAVHERQKWRVRVVGDEATGNQRSARPVPDGSSARPEEEIANGRLGRRDPSLLTGPLNWPGAVGRHLRTSGSPQLFSLVDAIKPGVLRVAAP